MKPSFSYTCATNNELSLKVMSLKKTLFEYDFKKKDTLSIYSNDLDFLIYINGIPQYNLDASKDKNGMISITMRSPNIDGNVTLENCNIKCDGILGDISLNNSTIDCGSIVGDVEVKNSTMDITGSVTGDITSVESTVNIGNDLIGDVYNN